MTVTVTVGDGDGLSVVDGVGAGSVGVGSVLGGGVTVIGKLQIGSDTGSNGATFEDGAAKSEDSPDGADKGEDKTDVELNILHYPTSVTSRFAVRSVTVPQGEQCQPVILIRRSGT